MWKKQHQWLSFYSSAVSTLILLSFLDCCNTEGKAGDTSSQSNDVSNSEARSRVNDSGDEIMTWKNMTKKTIRQGIDWKIGGKNTCLAS